MDVFKGDGVVQMLIACAPIARNESRKARIIAFITAHCTF